MKRKSILLLAGAIALSVFGGCVSTVLDTIENIDKIEKALI